jgi:PAS domain S-box-containing protein
MGILIKKDLMLVADKLENYRKDYEELLLKIQKRGFRDNGLEGSMRKFIHEAEAYQNSIDMVQLLTVRRNEKDYILRKDTSYIRKLENNLRLLHASVSESKLLNVREKIHLEKLLKCYLQTFQEYVKTDNEIGIDQGEGLIRKLKTDNEILEKIIGNVLANADQCEKKERSNNILIFSTTATLAILLSVLLSFYLSSVLTRPIRELSDAITETVRSNFRSKRIINSRVPENEIGNLMKSFNWMLEQIQVYITELKQNEIALHGKDKRFRALIENSNDAIALTDKDGRIIYASPSTTRLTGYSPEELITGSAMNFAHPDDYLILQKTYEQVLSAPANMVYLEFRLKDINGNWKWFDGYAANYLHDEYINAVIINYHDVTLRKNNELKIHEQNIELKKINTELDRFVYSASHDLKAPLTSILGIINVARIETDKNLNSRYFEMTEISIRKLLGIINDLTDFSRNARTEPESEEIEFGQIIQDAIDSYSHLEKSGKIRFTVRICEGSKFHSDALRLKILFNNLISNAIIYHNIHQPDPQINIEVKVDENGAELIICDNGQGIDRIYQSRVFEMFFRASDDSKGSGLGLYIVREIITKLMGTISLQSEPGEGTQFHIFLPALKILSYGKKTTVEKCVAC